MNISIDFPDRCANCGYKNFKIVGSSIDGGAEIEVHCIRCGKKAKVRRAGTAQKRR